MKKRDFLYLTYADMEQIGPSIGEIINLLEFGFQLKGQGQVMLPPKHWIERTGDRFYSAMSSYIPELGFSGCKWQSGDPHNSANGLPYIQGLYTLTEDQFGLPVAIMDSEWITGRRTAAASALAVKLLARPDAKTLAILGCGLQGRMHLEGICSVMPNLATVYVFDIQRKIAENFAQELTKKHNVSIIVTDSAKAAVSQAEVVISGGPILNPPQPTIEPGWLMSGVTAIAIDYDSYWTPAAMKSMDKIITDDRGQIEHLKEYGLFLGLPKLDGELADLVVNKISRRKSANDRILCFNLGIAIEDLVTAVEIFKRATAKSIGLMLSR